MSFTTSHNYQSGLNPQQNKHEDIQTCHILPKQQYSNCGFMNHIYSHMKSTYTQKTSYFSNH
jgi:hypothetical protein